MTYFGLFGASGNLNFGRQVYKLMDRQVVQEETHEMVWQKTFLHVGPLGVCPSLPVFFRGERGGVFRNNPGTY